MANLSTVKCPVCSSPMWDNREGKKNSKAPDYKCSSKTCKFKRLPNGQWVTSEFTTSLWESSMPIEALADASGVSVPLSPSQATTTPSYASAPPFHPKQKFTQAPGTERVPDQVWEAKDRTSMAQTSLKAAADIFQGQGTPSSEVIAMAEKFFRWIMDQRLDSKQDAPPVFDDDDFPPED